LRGGPARPPDFPKGCRGFNRRAAPRPELPRNQASFAFNPGHLAARMAWQTRFYVAEGNRRGRRTAGALTCAALQRLAFLLLGRKRPMVAGYACGDH